MQHCGLCSASLLFLLLAFIRVDPGRGRGESTRGLTLARLWLYHRAMLSSLGGYFSLGRIFWSFKFVVGSSSVFFVLLPSIPWYGCTWLNHLLVEGN